MQHQTTTAIATTATTVTTITTSTTTTGAAILSRGQAFGQN